MMPLMRLASPQRMHFASNFDFEAAVTAPFRMRPGMRRLPTGAAQLTPLQPGSRHQREKLAVLTAFWPQALCHQNGFDATPALHALFSHAASEHPGAWAWDGSLVEALWLATAVTADGEVLQRQPGQFGLGDEVARCLNGLPPAWRQTGLAALAFAEDFAIVDGQSGRVPWLAACLPSHWAPEETLGRHFSEIHAPVAENTLLLRATEGLMRVITGPDRWERFVWNVSDHPRLHAHPARVERQRWQHTPVASAWFRSERQTFIPLPGAAQAVFTIQVQVQPLAALLDSTARAQALHDAVASMSETVLTYRSLRGVREPLLAWLAARALAPA